jgi:membrane-bound inhibitor of C-type lysozyme
MKRLVVLAGLAALAACATDGSGAVIGGDGSIGGRFTWHCDGGHTFNVGFTRNGAQVSVNGRTYNLVHAQSASGARYSNGSVEYWERAGQVQLSGVAGGPYVNCRRR